MAAFPLPCATSGAVLVSQPPFTGGTARWSQLWQDPGPGENDLDSDAICWTDFTLTAATAINHIEWWGAGACELGFRIDFWPQDSGTIAYQPLAVFDVGPGPSPVTPTARFLVTPSDYITNSAPGGLVHFSLDLANPVALAANNSANPRWFIAIIGYTHQAYYTWNWAQGLGSARTFQWIRADGSRFHSLGDGRALVLADERPVLTITHSGGSMTIRWPLPADGFALERTSSLEGIPPTWVPVIAPHQTNAMDISVTVTVGAGSNFYRLRKP